MKSIDGTVISSCLMVFGDGGYRYVSHSVTAMLGREGADLLGDKIDELSRRRIVPS